MANDNHDDASRDAMNGLPQKEREETQKIIDEIAAEEKGKADAPADDKPKDGDQKPKDGDKPAEGDGKPADGKQKKDGEGDKGKDENRVRRSGKLIPAYVHYSAESKWKARESELTATITDLTKKVQDAAKTAPKEEGGDGKPKAASREEKVKALAETHGYSEEVIKGILDLVDDGKQLPPEIVKQIAEMSETTKTLKQSREAELEEQEFNRDFDSQILPLIKAEYGDDVPQNVIEDIKEDLKAFAYGDAKYAEVPYDEIYNGKKEFRGVLPPKKKGAEHTHTGGAEGALDAENPGEIDLTKPLSDDAISKLSTKQLETYFANMDKWEKGNKK